MGEVSRKEVEVEVEEVVPEGQLFPESQIETVKPEPRRREPRENSLKVTFKKIGSKINEAWGGLYDSINEDISND